MFENFQQSDLEEFERAFSSEISSDKPARVVMTLDHFDEYSYTYTKKMVEGGIPVTVFTWCTDPKNGCPSEKDMLEKLKELNTHSSGKELVKFGAHSLPMDSSQEDQKKNLEVINNLLYPDSDQKSRILSYHGSGAGPVEGIEFEGIDYARSTNNDVENLTMFDERLFRVGSPLDIPVVRIDERDPVKYAALYIEHRNKIGKSAVFYAHAADIKNVEEVRKVFYAILYNITEAKILVAEDFHTACKKDYGSW